MDKPTENALAIIGPPKAKDTKADQPLPLDAPAMDASAEAITIDLSAFESKVDTPPPESADQKETAAPWIGSVLWEKLSPLTTPLALATVLGILAGTAATVALMPDKPSPAPAVAALPDETRVLQDRVTKLSSDLAALKSGFDAANRSATAQLNKIGDRLDRAEKSQAEPAAKLAKIMETLDRLERRTASAAPPADVTGSVTSVEKQQTKPPAIEGWKLHDFYAGRAVLENRTGTLFEVGPGSTLPGVGKIETIKRVDGKVVITTPKGTITSSLESPAPQSQPRRPQQYYLPPGYY